MTAAQSEEMRVWYARGCPPTPRPPNDGDAHRCYVAAHWACDTATTAQHPPPLPGPLDAGGLAPRARPYDLAAWVAAGRPAS